MLRVLVFDPEGALFEEVRGIAPAHEVALGRAVSSAELEAAFDAGPWDVVILDKDSAPTGALALIEGRSEDVALLILVGARNRAKLLRQIQGARSARVAVDAPDWLALLTTIAAAVGHHINNPLATVAANVDLVSEAIAELRDRTDAAGALARDIEQPLRDASEAAMRMRVFVNDLAVDRRRGGDALEETDVRALIEAAVGVAATDSRRRVRVSLEMTAVPKTVVHRRALLHVLANLVARALHGLDHDGVEGTVAVRVAMAPRGFVCVEVGTSSGDAPWALSEGDSRVLGAGLSLVVCQRMLAAFGGQIEVSPQGATISVLLPTVATAARSVSTAATEGSAPGGAPEAPLAVAPARTRVLVVDDDGPLGRSVARTLRDVHDVVVRTRAKEALDEILAGARYDAIVCDLIMDEMSGMDLHEELQRRVPDQAKRMLFLTGGAFTRAASLFVETIDRPVLGKPFDRHELRSVVKKIADG